MQPHSLSSCPHDGDIECDCDRRYVRDWRVREAERGEVLILGNVDSFWREIRWIFHCQPQPQHLRPSPSPITDAVAVDTILSCKSMEIVDNEIHPSIDSVLRLTSAFYLRIRTIPNCGTVSSPMSIFDFDDDDDDDADDEKQCPSNVIQ